MDKKHLDLKNCIETDWFVGAIHFDGLVKDSLKFVIDQLEKKQNFVAQLQRKLCSGGRDSDRLTHMGREVKELENTLRFRLGILQPERPASWFRTIQRKDFGPFRSPMLVAPVFGDYKLEQVKKVQADIKLAWGNCQTSLLPFDGTRGSLWHILLAKREELSRLTAFEHPFDGLKLENLPEELPSDFESRSLRAFLINVRNEYLSIVDRLQLCYDQLWSASERLWRYQETLIRQSDSDRSRKQRTSRQQQGTNGAQRKPFSRELGTAYADILAMRYMGFDEKPDDEGLKKRYREMAKKYHPDREGGSEERFKKLTEAYRRLSAKRAGKPI